MGQDRKGNYGKEKKSKGIERKRNYGKKGEMTLWDGTGQKKKGTYTMG